MRFPKFDENWEKKKLEDVGKIRMCKRIFNHQTSVSGDIPFFKIGTFGKKPDSFIPNELYHEFKHKYSYPKVGDILISASGTLGRTVVFDGSPSYFQDSNIVWIDNKENLITNEFLYYIYKIVRYESEGGTIQRLYNSIIYNTKFWKPSLPEQQKIADFLTGVDKRIELLEKKKTLLETYKKGVMKKIFNQEIRFKDDNGNDFPDWEEKRLGEVCKIQKGKQLNKSELIDTGEYPAINGGINPSGYTDEWNTVADTITISEGGNSCGYVNYIKTNFWCGGHCYSLLEIQNYLQKVYLFEYLKFRESSIMNLRVGSGLPNIQKREIDSFHILIPSINEQKTISSFLSTIGNQIELLETQIDKSKTWKKGLLQKMFV
ncbi:restriction endonuclease subunit S [Flavobacteriaceae bacterium]|nr:restriction endonuclease subunit S [Flavobacteriaceae bacterium]